MSKLDNIKEKINILRDDHKNMFIFFMTILTGSFTVFYQVIIGKLVLFYSLIGLSGVIVAFMIIYKMNRLRKNIDILINELEDL
ncbi:MAG: hypothetical protein GQ570_00420 [Helicobacteraceae bacterium]|nr:hypothetical protein [Helicobacteraceae bacterium]